MRMIAHSYVRHMPHATAQHNSGMLVNSLTSVCNEKLVEKAFWHCSHSAMDRGDLLYFNKSINHMEIYVRVLSMHATRTNSG